MRVLVLACLAAVSVAPAFAQGVLDEWAGVRAPPPPALSRVTLEPKTTALLVLDLAAQTCTTRPRCVAMLPRAAALLAHARAKNWLVVYTLGGASAPADILGPVAMLGGEPVVKASPDKFVNTDLEKLLHDRGVTTVVAMGAASNGAVLHTAATAAFRGFDVVVPVDGMAGDSAYAEQFAAWDVLNGPRLAEHVKLSAIGMIE